MSTRDNGMYGFSHTDLPSDVLSGNWTNVDAVAPGFAEFDDSGSPQFCHNDDYVLTSGQSTPRGARTDQVPHTDPTWMGRRSRASSKHMLSQNMSQVASNAGHGSSMTSLTQHDQVAFPGHFPLSDSVTAAGDACLPLALDGAPPRQVQWPVLSTGRSMTPAYAAFSAAGAAGCSPSLHMAPAHMHLGSDSSMQENSSPGPWDCFSSSISRRSSPATVDDMWLPTALSPNCSAQAADDPLR